ncbi:MAG: hypothetical protein JO126_06750 [Alphaproteobacteria bacterium]|nr:hypothetical protein [Alphaproteobacteria bacterium]
MSDQTTIISAYVRLLFTSVFLPLCADLIISALELFMIYLMAAFAVYVLAGANEIVTKGLHYAAECMAAVYLLSSFYVAQRRYLIIARQTPVHKDTQIESEASHPAEESQK